MSELFKHQVQGIGWLTQHIGALLRWQMRTGKTRTALLAARRLYDSRRVDRVLVLCPAAVTSVWRDEARKLSTESGSFDCNILKYQRPKITEKMENHHRKMPAMCFQTQEVLGKLNGNPRGHMPIAVVSYGLVQNKDHVEAMSAWCAAGDTVLVCDESSYLKNRTAKQSKGAETIASACAYRWLLSGTPIAQGPLDLWQQAEVMFPDDRNSGPLYGFSTFYSFRGRFAEMVTQHFHGMKPFQKLTGVYFHMEELAQRFAPWVSSVDAKDCLDMPDEVYTRREVALSKESWKRYKDLKAQCLLSMPDGSLQPEPNAAVRLLRLAQLTSGQSGSTKLQDFHIDGCDVDLSSEKLDWLVSEITEGELANERALVVWCRWRRERERLMEKLANDKRIYDDDYEVYEVYGGQSASERVNNIQGFQELSGRRGFFLGQPHAGGFGLDLSVANVAVYLSNDYSWPIRVQSQARTQHPEKKQSCLYMDVLAVGPNGERTVDHGILDALASKEDIATWTCDRWKKALE